MRHCLRTLLGMGVVLELVTGAPAAGQTLDAPIPHASGQSVTPSFEGWYPNADGTFSLSFGYMNRNYEEKLDIQVGSDNRFAPGVADRGQPTHFLPRRHTGVFTIVVPADFSEKQLTWTLINGGETTSVPGHLRPEWEITALEEITSGNTPPVLKFDPAAESGQGPRGTSGTLQTSFPDATVIVWARDDGLRRVKDAHNPPQSATAP